MKEELKEVIALMADITKYGVIGICSYFFCKLLERPLTVIITWGGILIAIKIICSTITTCVK